MAELTPSMTEEERHTKPPWTFFRGTIRNRHGERLVTGTFYRIRATILILAAPDLLAACVAVQPILRGLLSESWDRPENWHKPDNERVAVWKQLEAAIAKAKGD